MLPAAVGLGDEAEAQTVPYILGIAHPTGFPLYTLLGWLWSHALVFSTVAWRLNAFAAFCTAAGVTGVFLLARELSQQRIVSALAALAFAFGATTWLDALHANAQVLSAPLTVFVLWTAIVFARTGNVRFLVASCACNGFALATHPNALWTLPAIAVAAVWQRKAIRTGSGLIAIVALIVPLSLYAYFPIRSSIVAAQGLDPGAAAPLFGAGRLDWDINSPRTFDGFLDEVLGRKYGAAFAVSKMGQSSTLPLAVQLWGSMLSRQYGVLLLALAAVGLTALLYADRRALSILIVGTVAGIAFLYSYRHDAHLSRYAFVSFAVVAALSAACVRLTPWLFAQRPVRIVSTVALLAVVTFALSQFRPAGIPLEQTGLGIIAEVEHDVPDGAIVVAQWDMATPLGYASYVSHTFGSRTIVGGWPANFYDESLRWAKVRPTYYLVDGISIMQLMPLPPGLKSSRGHLFGYGIIEVVPEKSAGRKPL